VLACPSPPCRETPNRGWYTYSISDRLTKDWRLPLALVVAVAAVGVIVAVLALTGSDSDEPEPAAAAPNVVQAGAPGESSRALSEDELAEVETPTPTKADVDFVHGMIHHHAQAVQMTAFVPERAVGRDLRLLARRMQIAQVGEIELMEGWLRKRDEEVPGTSLHAHGHVGVLMPGMLTEPQVARLKAASGQPFNRRFLRSMIRHHRGAFTMIERLRATNGGMEPELDRMIRHIEADQSIEIDRMRQLLADA
jgi:uncharacterized protein (DUF305 family)